VISTASLASEASMPGSVVADICFEVAGGTRPRKGCAYDLRNVVRRGKDAREGSLDSYQPSGHIQHVCIRKKAY
jgi:hypothetical protein